MVGEEKGRKVLEILMMNGQCSPLSNANSENGKKDKNLYEVEEAGCQQVNGWSALVPLLLCSCCAFAPADERETPSVLCCPFTS